MTCVFVTVRVMVGLRGYEIMFMNLSGLKIRHNKGNNYHTYSHVVVLLLGRFKGESEKMCLAFPLPLKSKLSFQPAPWIGRVLMLHVVEGWTDGQFFSDKNGKGLKPTFCEIKFIESVERVRQEHPKIIDMEMDYFRLFGSVYLLEEPQILRPDKKSYQTRLLIDGIDRGRLKVRKLESCN